MDVRITLVLVVLAGRATVSSSLNYTAGTEALEKGDFETAVVHLEEAVRLDPSLSRNHNNLAYAYYETGRLQEAWDHGRKAVLLDPDNEYARANSRRIFAAMWNEVGLKAGASEDAVRLKLGTPDGTNDSRDEVCGCIWWQYGFTALSIVDGEVTGYNEMVYQPR